MAAMQFKFTITYLDGTTVETESIPFDIIRWERLSKKSFASDEPTFESLMWIAWCAGRRTNVIEEKLFDDWGARVADMKIGDDDDTADGEADPTQPED